MAQAPGTATTTSTNEHAAPTALEKLAVEVHGNPGKLLAALATQERWAWGDVALLMLGSRKALADAMKKLEEETEATQKKTAEMQAKADEAVRKMADERAKAAAPAHP